MRIILQIKTAVAQRAMAVDSGENRIYPSAIATEHKLLILFFFIKSKKPSKRWLFTFCGEDRIRTCEEFNPLHAFQACAFNHSATSPYSLLLQNNFIIICFFFMSAQRALCCSPLTTRPLHLLISWTGQ